jgi:flavorubredoxin
MRVAVVFVSKSKRDKLLGVAQALAAGIESQGHSVEVIDGARDVNVKLTIYEYIAVGTEVVSTFGGKIPDRAGEFLKSSGIVSGKRSFAFVLKSPFGDAKALQRMMKVMEGEGMFLRFSEVLSSPADAKEIGKRLRIG